MAALVALERQLKDTEEDATFNQDKNHSIPDVIGTYETANVANLHAQVVAVQNIRSLVMVVLDPLSTHYTHWCDLMLLTLCRYALDGHVFMSSPTPCPAIGTTTSSCPGSSAPSLSSFKRSSTSPGRRLNPL
jgi:hypothetical protein